MSGRIYVCPVVFQAATAESPALQFAHVSSLPGVVRCRALIATEESGPQRGRARLPWALCYVEATDWSAVDADPDCTHVTMDDPPEAVKLPPKGPVKTGLVGRGVLSAAEVDQPTGRDLARLLARKHDPSLSFARTFPELA